MTNTAAGRSLPLPHLGQHVHLRPRGHVEVSRQSRIGLYIANFFLAELVGVLLPLLGDFLQAHRWRFDAIGVATSMAGLGLLLAQLPAGTLLDRMHHYRRTLMVAALTVGMCFGAMPLMVHRPVVLNALLFVTGIGQAFIMPLLGTLALALAGQAGVNELMGSSQSARGMGNVFASLMVMALVLRFGMASAFYTITIVSLGAALSVFIIRKPELHGDVPLAHKQSWSSLLHDSRVRRLVGCSALFHLANAAVTPMVAVYARQLGGQPGFVTKLVFAAQLTMVAASALAGRAGDRLGRKPAMGLAFVVLPVRVALYALFTNPDWFIAVAVLDGLAVGTYNVVIASVCADIDAGHGRFNTLMGLVFTTLALGSVVSPLVGGVVVQHFGFHAAFMMFAAVAAVGAAFYIALMPETIAETRTTA